MRFFVIGLDSYGLAQASHGVARLLLLLHYVSKVVYENRNGCSIKDAQKDFSPTLNGVW